MDDKEKLINENKELCSKYPFLIPHNRFSDEVDLNYDYTYTELDDMPEGWRKKFGMQMLDELKQVLEEENNLEEFRILQIKEKYGSLRFYTNCCTEKISKLIHKYENISSTTCIKCGEPATVISTGWISPWCDECSKNIHGELIPVDVWFADEEDLI